MRFTPLILLAPFLVLSSTSPIEIEKRVNGEITFYYPAGATGACGKPIANSDLVGALPHAVFDKKNHCGASVKVTANGKSVTVKIQDRCSGCVSREMEIFFLSFEYVKNMALIARNYLPYRKLPILT